MRRLLLPVLATGLAEGIPRRSEYEKVSLFLKTESEGLAVFPRTLSVEELGKLKVPGQVSWLSGRHRVLSLPLLRRAEQWPSAA